MGVDKVNKSFQSINSFDDPEASSAIPSHIEEEKKSTPDFDKPLNTTRMFLKESPRDFHPCDYLDMLDSHINSKLISNRNLSEIKKLAGNLTEGLTSFFGFESRLESDQPRADYLLAISSQQGEKEALYNLFEKKDSLDISLDKKEWKNIKYFTKSWLDPESVLYDNILGVWLEFDTANPQVSSDIPSVFLQINPLRIDKPEDVDKCLWVTRSAIPKLTGSSVSKELEKLFIKTLVNLPDKASVFHVASMLSRNTEGLRLVIKRMDPDKIVSYLKSLGWKDEKNGLENLLQEIKKYVTTIRLHINLTDKIDPKVGLECFISPNKYHDVDGWDNFLDYLVQKGLCKQKIRDSLINFQGVELENTNSEFNLNSYMPSVKISDGNFVNKAVVRYISHVKLTYKPKEKIEAKAYTGVRLFGCNE